MKEKLLNNLSFFIGILTVVLVVVFNSNFLLASFIGGIGAFLYGILVSLNKNNYGYLFISLGIGAFSTIILYRSGIFDKVDAITYMICVSVFVLMFITFIFSFINKKENSKLYNLEVEAIVVDLVKNKNTKKDFYQVIYEYELEEKRYTVGTPGFIEKNIPNIGDKKKIYVDSKDHSNVYFDKSLMEKMTNNAIVLSLMIVSLIIIISLFF